LALATSRVLRGLTVAVLVGCVLLLSISGAAIYFGATRAMEEVEQERQQAVEEVAANFRPDVVDRSTVESFQAVLYTPGSHGPAAASVAAFTLAGPDSSTARSTDQDVRHIAFDAEDERCFALTRHGFGTVTPSSGRFTKIEVDPSLAEFSWPKGIAYDSARGRVVIMTSHVYTRFFSYEPRTSDWQELPVELRDMPLVALAYAQEDDTLYALERRSRALALETIHRFNAQGAAVGTVTLQPPIPVTEGHDERYQLACSSGRIVLLLPPYEDKTQPEVAAIGRVGGVRIFVVEPESGRVLAAPTLDTP
jgi:hypothetical protein